MEYKINEYNITDIKYKDLKGLISCFESSIPLSKISLCNFGPNIMHLKSTENKFPKTKEDKKILKYQSNLILSSLNSKEKNEESNFCFSMSNNINKIYLKRFLNQMNALLQARNKNKENDIDNNNKENKQDIKELMNFFNLISYFTCIRDEYGDEIPITDYCLSMAVDKSIKYNKLNLIQFNYEFVTQNIINSFQTNIDRDNDSCVKKNNINIFYMLIYCLPINELYNYLYCEETKDYFSIFSEEETLDEITKRFIFINQFKLLKNDISYRFMTINNDNGDETEDNNNENIRYNINAIKNEYNYYSILYNNYLKIKENFLISNKNKKKIFGNCFSILLLSEFDFMHDELIINILNKSYRELQYYDDKSLTNIFSILRNILINDIRFNFLSSNKNQIDRKRYPYLLSKISYCLGIPEDKILYILITDNNGSDNKENIITDEISIFKNILNLINILYLKSIDNLMEIFPSYNKKKKLTISNGTNKPRKTLNIFLMRSNLVYNITYEKYLFSNNSFLAISDNFIDSNSFIISHNIKEHLYSNYIQEKKNYIYLKNSLSLNFDKNFPKILENSEYLNSIFRENLNFEEIINVYENEICGLLKLINYSNNSNNNTNNFNIFDSKKNFNINHFKVQFNKNISRKNKIEIIDVFNSANQKNEIFMKVTHTFGVFLYDLSKLFNIDNSSNANLSNRSNNFNTNELIIMPNACKEQMINKLLEYKPYSYNTSSVKYIQENTTKIITSLSLSKKPIYISCLLELNKFNTLTLFDDMKINIIYVYYSNYYNYILNINDIKQYLLQNYNNVIPKNMKNKDNLTLFKFLSKKIRITASDYITDKYYKNRENNIHGSKYRNNRDYNNLIDYIFVKNKLSNLFGNERNISLMIYKYNYKQYLQIFCDKLSKSKFHYFIYAINGVKAFVKLTKIYKEKSVLSNVRNLMTDIIVDNYDLIKEEELKNIKKNEPIFNSLSPINQKLLPKIDNLEELIFDFNKEALGKMLPKLRTNLVHLQRIWRDYIYDIVYLINNASNFYNKECTELVIEQRMLNFQILLFLFHKNYKFINSESVKKYGILVTEFTKTVSIEVLRLLGELKKDFDDFLSENNKINKNLADFRKNFENITFEKLILKRIELQNVISQKVKEKENNFFKINQQKMREKNLDNKNWNSNGGEEGPLLQKNKISKYNSNNRGNDINKNRNNKNVKDNNNENKFKEFTISQKDLNEGRLDNSLRMSKSRKPSSRAIESFNTVNRNSQLQITIKNTSEDNTPKTLDYYNFSDFEENNNQKYKNDNNYEYKVDNVSFRNIDETSNKKNNKAKIVYSNKPNNNYEENNNVNKMPKNENNSSSVIYKRRRDSKNKNNSNNNSNNNNRNDNLKNNNYPEKNKIIINPNSNNPENNDLPNKNKYQNYYRVIHEQQNKRNEKDNNNNNNQVRNEMKPRNDRNINNNRNNYANDNKNNHQFNNRMNNNNPNININDNDRNNEINGVNKYPGNYIRNNNDNNDNKNNNRNFGNKFVNKEEPVYNKENNISNQNKPNIINISNNNTNDNNENIPYDYNNNNDRKRTLSNIIAPNEYDNKKDANNIYDNNENPNKDNKDTNLRGNKNKYKNSYIINGEDKNNLDKIGNKDENTDSKKDDISNNDCDKNNNKEIDNDNDKDNELNNDNINKINDDYNNLNSNDNNNPDENYNINNNIQKYNNNSEDDKNDEMPIKNTLNKYNNNDIDNNLNNNLEDNINDSPSFTKPIPKIDPKNGSVSDRNNYSFKNDNEKNNQNLNKDNSNSSEPKDINNNKNNKNDDNENMDKENMDNQNYIENKPPIEDRYKNNPKNNNDKSNDDTKRRNSKNNSKKNLNDNNNLQKRNSKTNSKNNFNNSNKEPNNQKNSNKNSKKNLLPNDSKSNSSKNFNDNSIPNNSKNNSCKNFNNNVPKPNKSKNNSYKNFNDDKNENNDKNEKNNEIDNPKDNINDNEDEHPIENENKNDSKNNETNNLNNDYNEKDNEDNNDDNSNYISFKGNNINDNNNNNQNKTKNKGKQENKNNDENDNENNNKNNEEEEEYNENEENDKDNEEENNQNEENNDKEKRNENNKKMNNNKKLKSKEKKPNNVNKTKAKNIQNEEEENEEIEDIEENPDANNQDDGLNGENEENEDLKDYYVSWLPDEELQKIYQTLSDVNEVEIEKNIPKNYITYPFDEKKDNLKTTKDLPEKVKKRLNVCVVRLIKEKEIKNISDNDINLLYLKDLENKIKQIRKEINYIDINDSIFEKIEELHYNEESFDENNLVDYKLYNTAEELNKDFYDNIELKLQMTEEAINN